MTGFATRAVHGDTAQHHAHGALRPPIYDGVTFEFADAAAIEAAFAGTKPAHAYTRISNPTVAAFEERVRVLANAQGVVAVASGMAAIATIVLAVAAAGEEIILSPYLFGNTHSLFTRTLKPWGITAVFDDFSDPQRLRRCITPRTRAIFFEPITNPQLQVADVPMLAAIAAAHDVLLIADSTALTPYLFAAGSWGVHIDVISSTKYMSGGATSVGGVIIDYGSYPWQRHPRLSADARRYGPFTLLAALRRQVFRDLGSCLSPHNAYLQTLGLETLALRVEQSCDTALSVAQRLREHPRVARVDYPGLPTHPGYALVQQLFNGRGGGILTFDLADKAQCFSCIDKLRLIRRATNINDNKTLVIHPASTIFQEFSAAEKNRMGVRESMIRLAVGIEDSQDVIADLAQALEAMT